VIGRGRFGPAGSRARGFTLMDLMITLVIVAVLAAIALPSYRLILQRANRADAKAILMESSQFMERYFTANNTFTGAPAVPYAVSPKGATGLDIKYNISYVGTPGATYVIQAVPANSQASDSCATLTISNTGAQTPTTAGCW
jgi:type IV pilus assembly protein PilE